MLLLCLQYVYLNIPGQTLSNYSSSFNVKGSNAAFCLLRIARKMQISVRTRANDLVDSLERTDGKMQPESKQHDSFVDTAGRAAMNMVKKKRNKTKTSAFILRVSTETEQLKHNQKQKQTQV